jgi:TPR repeat protein
MRRAAALGAFFSESAIMCVDQDYAEAVRLYRLASAQGDAFAQYHLGLVFEKGEVVARDTEEAMRWFRLAAAQGDAWAKANLKRLGA